MSRTFYKEWVLILWPSTLFFIYNFAILQEQVPWKAFWASRKWLRLILLGLASLRPRGDTWALHHTMDECSSLGHWLVLFLFPIASQNTFILLTGHPFRITLSFDALVSKDTFFGKTICFQYLEVDIPCDKNHINQHRDTLLYMETYSNIEVKVGEIPDVTSQVTSRG